jgi:hypothetical protein
MHSHTEPIKAQTKNIFKQQKPLLTPQKQQQNPSINMQHTEFESQKNKHGLELKNYSNTS